MTAYSIACLAGDGIGPEVMAQASRGMRAAARLHGFELDEEHVPFGADATMRVGQPFPLASRNAALAADAILAATIDQTLLHSLEGELDLRAAVMRARLRGAAITFVAPLRSDAWDWTLERAIATARSSRGHLTFVGSEDGWTAEAAAASERDDGLERHAPLHAPHDPHARVEPGVVRRHRLRSAAARPTGRAGAGASTPGGCSPGAGSPRTARASSGRATEPPPTSRARASRIRARCCSQPR